MIKLTASFLFLLFMKGVISVGLYSPEDDVISLDTGNINSAVTGKPYGWMIEFYATWCGHCRHFAPLYKQFAKEILPWKDILKVGAVDCANPENEDVCMKYKITGYPSIKYIFPGADEENIGVFRTSWDKSVEALKRDTIFYIQAMQWEQNITHWPSLDAVEGPFEDLIENGGQKEMFIILEDEESYTGREVLLDIHGTNRGTENVARMVVKYPYMNDDIKNILSNSDLPALIRIGRGQSNFDVLRTEVSAREAETIIYNHYNGMLSTLAPTRPQRPDQPVTTSKKASADQLKRRRYTVMLTDLEKTVLYALTHEVVAHGELSDDQQYALVDFLNVLIEFLPRSSAILTSLVKLSAVGQLGPESIKETLEELSEVYENQEWSSCRGSKPKFGGYPCGQWMLWHTLTVNQMKEEQGDPTRVLRAMNGYIKHFFGCRECSNHFVAMTKDGEDFKKIVTYQESVLYLWEKHNQVNARLSGDTSDDPVFPKFQFPSSSQCSSCYLTDGSPDEQEILMFLSSMYGSPVVVSNTSTSLFSDLTYSLGFLLGAMLT